MRPEKPKTIRRAAAGSDKKEVGRAKPVYRKATGDDKEEKPRGKTVYRKAAGDDKEEKGRPKPVARKSVREFKDEPARPKAIYRKSAGDAVENVKRPKSISRKSAGDETTVPKRTKTISRIPAGVEREPGRRPVSPRRKAENKDDGELIRLNKYIANSGMCSRREADKMIEAGIVSVNGKMVTELGTKVSPTDKVKYADEIINREKPKYLLLNKPKGFITTVDDPENRKTVMALVAGACKERIYPVGRLDRNTTGLLFFTNDGNMAKKLSHPRYGIKKIYHVEIGKPLTKADFEKISAGFKLEDDFVQVDAIEYIGDGKDKKQIGIELHSGKNRIVRRIFEHFEYEVVKLDRVYYAGLTKKNLPRGTWRFLEEHEINMLKMISTKT